MQRRKRAGESVTIKRFFLRFDARAELSKIGCPTLIIAGSDDKTVGKDAPTELKSRIFDKRMNITKCYKPHETIKMMAKTT